ncbi:MAG: hypothetical protein K6G23_07535 [Lachnospiraceae bacterium]|nr:hypothetical protein [Lachnospiraceae bacterium]
MKAERKRKESGKRAERKQKESRKEKIVMEDYKNQLREQVDLLDFYILQAEEQLKKSKKIKKCVICTSTRKNGYQYYLLENGKRIYVKKQDMDKVRGILQKEYDEAMYKALITVRYRIQLFIKQYDLNRIDQVYSGMGDARKQLVKPLIPTDEQFVEEWYQTYKGNQNSFPEQGSYLTARGEHVRSKSEKIIADLFEKYKIPYRYEPMLELSDGRCVYPDFVVLNVRRRKTIYWEHFGLITDGDYARKALGKLSIYEESGYVVGDDLLFSMESDRIPLNVKLLERKIHQHIL